MNYLKSKGYICRFLTNKDSKKTSHILDIVKNLGFNIELDEIFTPVTASVKFLKCNNKAKIYVLVSDSIINELVGAIAVGYATETSTQRPRKRWKIL